ncbi:MAG: hypothetical protein IJZ55_00470 [Lachnospiraceae bacterium]|nr:hypothetical protein [Lachnospiraceae bacterium]
MRMRKFLAVALSVALVFSAAACGKKDDNKNQGEGENITATVAPTEDESGDKEESGVIAPEFTAGTAGEKLWNAFLETMKANPETAPIDMANTLSTNPVIQFMAGGMEVEPGFLAGFSEDITGFEKGAMYGPMMGSIAFAGYIFELADDADVNAFIELLKSKADPRWNICVAADYTQVGAYENTVYFLMYPAEMDNASAEGGEGATEEAVVIYPDVEMGTWGETLWEAFETTMTDNPSSTAVDAAFMLSMHESIPAEAMYGSAEIMPGLLSGFDNFEVTGFKSGAMFGPMMGSVAFIGYVFELEEGADVEPFMTLLTANSNPRWNVCVEAEQTVVGAYNNMVFFLMCPNSNQGE